MRKVTKTRSPTMSVIYFNFINILLLIIVIFLVFSLIKERIYLEQNKYLINKYRAYLSQIINKNVSLLQSVEKETANPSSSTNLIYLTPGSFSYLQNLKP